MTSNVLQETAVSKSDRAATRTRPYREIVGVGTVLFLLAFALRAFAIVPSYDLFIDEITYSEIARNLATGHGLTLYGDPFNLHPPAVFATLAIVIKLFHLTGGIAHVAFQLRLVSAVFGSLTVVVSYLLMRSARVGKAIAIAGALVLAIEPFLISFDSRVMLEAETQFFAVCTVLLLVVVGEGPVRHRRAVVGIAGFTGATTMFGKETFGLVLVLTLVLVAWTQWVGRRRDTLAVLGISAAGYTAATIAVWLTSGFRPWWQAHVSGLTRLLGTHQITGFNSPTTKVSLVSRVLANVANYSVSYVVLLVGGLSVLFLVLQRLRRKGSVDEPGAPAVAAVTLWGFASCTYLVYATVVGSLEEQMYYIALVPCLLAVVLVIRQLAHTGGRVARTACVIAAGLALFVDAGVWVQVHTHDSNGYRQLLNWEPTHVAAGSRISVTEDSAQFLLQDAVIGVWSTPTALKANHADYVLLQTGLVEQGYGTATSTLLTYLDSNAALVFRSDETRDGRLELFDVRALTGGSNTK